MVPIKLSQIKYIPSWLRLKMQAQAAVGDRYADENVFIDPKSIGLTGGQQEAAYYYDGDTDNGTNAFYFQSTRTLTRDFYLQVVSEGAVTLTVQQSIDGVNWSDTIPSATTITLTGGSQATPKIALVKLAGSCGTMFYKLTPTSGSATAKYCINVSY